MPEEVVTLRGVTRIIVAPTIRKAVATGILVMLNLMTGCAAGGPDQSQPSRSTAASQPEQALRPAGQNDYVTGQAGNMAEQDARATKPTVPPPGQTPRPRPDPGAAASAPRPAQAALADQGVLRPSGTTQPPASDRRMGSYEHRLFSPHRSRAFRPVSAVRVALCADRGGRGRQLHPRPEHRAEHHRPLGRGS